MSPSQNIEADTVCALLEPDGQLSQQLDSYELRSGQVALAELIVRSFNEGRPLVVEAGTGIGKSLAYLLPALLWLEKNSDERVLISTATIALQQQIIEKDLPLAQKFIGEEITTALVKGRGNYICLKRLDDMDASSDIFTHSNEIESIRQWSSSSPSGERSDLPFFSDEGSMGTYMLRIGFLYGAFLPVL